MLDCVTTSNRTKWSLVCNHMSDNKIGQLCSEGPLCLSWVWLQTELDDTKSFFQLIIKTFSKLRNMLEYCHCSRETNSPFWRKPQFRNLYTVSMVIETKLVIGWFKLQLWMYLAYWTVWWQLCKWISEK